MSIIRVIIIIWRRKRWIKGNRPSSWGFLTAGDTYFPVWEALPHRARYMGAGNAGPSAPREGRSKQVIGNHVRRMNTLVTELPFVTLRVGTESPVVHKIDLLWLSHVFKHTRQKQQNLCLWLSCGSRLLVVGGHGIVITQKPKYRVGWEVGCSGPREDS